MQTIKIVGFVMFLITNVTTDMAGECDLAGFYLEIGCTPVPRADNSSICAEAFTCPDLQPDPTMCYYKGISYRGILPQNVIENPCSQACNCRVTNGEPRFECAVMDCVEAFDPELQQDCFRTYELNKCCSTGTVCGKDEIAKLKTCDVDGKTYKEGEQFYPQNTMKSCICTSDWDGTVENSAYCRDINCGLEINYQNDILKNCAPVFVGTGRSDCPIYFVCPSPTSKVIRGLSIRTVDSQCIFGNVTLNVGDEVTVDEKCTKCVCNVPPFVSCTLEKTCDK